MAMQNPSQFSDTVVQALLDKGANPNLLAYQSPEFHFLWDSTRHSLSPLDVSLSEDELGGLEPPIAQAYQDAVSALVQAGGKHTNAYQARVKGKEEVFRAPTENQGGAMLYTRVAPCCRLPSLGVMSLFKSFSSKTEQMFNTLILERVEIIWNSKFGLSVLDMKVSGGKIPQTIHSILKF